MAEPVFNPEQCTQREMAAASREIEFHCEARALVKSPTHFNPLLLGNLRNICAQASDHDHLLSDVLTELKEMTGHHGHGLASLLHSKDSGAKSAPDDIIREALMRWLGTAAEEMLTEATELLAARAYPKRDENRIYAELRNNAAEKLQKALLSKPALKQDALADYQKAARQIIDSPSGLWDAIAWFDFGWAVWKAEGNTAEAALSFARAADVAAKTHNPVEAYSLRHLAYMKYLRGDYSTAYEACNRAMLLRPTYSIIFDLARYAALLSKDREAVNLLGQALKATPIVYILMLGEPDFDIIAPQIADMAQEVSDSIRTSARACVNNWQRAIDASVAKCSQVGLQLEIPPALGEHLEEYRLQAPTANYLVASEIIRQSIDKHDAVFSAAETALAWEVARKRTSVAQADAEIEDTKRRMDAIVRKAQRIREEETDRASRERFSSIKPNMLGCWIASAVCSGVCAAITQNIQLALSMFLPSFVGAAAIAFLIKVIAALTAYSMAVGEAKRRYQIATAEADQWFRKSLPRLQLQSGQLAQERDKIERALHEIRQRTYLTQ